MKTIMRCLVILVVLCGLQPTHSSAQAPDLPLDSLPGAAVLPPADQEIGEKGGSPAGPPWTVERIEDPHFFSQAAPAKHNLKVDSTGSPHIVYGGDHLYHTWWGLGTWHTEVVDSALNVGSYASLAIDGVDKLHIAYYDAANGDLKYATNRYGYWLISTLVSSGNVGAGTDIGVSGQDPYIVYRDNTNTHLMLLFMENGTIYETPENISGSLVPLNFAMASRNFQDIHVVFNSIHDTGSELEGTLYYTSSKQSSPWMPDATPFTGDANMGSLADIAVDSNSYPHVVLWYSDDEVQITRYLYSDDHGLSWTGFGEGQGVLNVIPQGLAMVLNPANQPTVALQAGGKLYKYTCESDESAWVSALVDTRNGTGFYPAVALYPTSTSNSGNPAFAYLDDPAGKAIFLNYREIYLGSWWPAESPAQVDQSQKVGGCSSALTGPDGSPWLVYSGETTGRLYFKRYYNGAWTAAQEIGAAQGGTINCVHAAAVGGGVAGVLFTTESADLLYTTISCSGSGCNIPTASVIQNGIGNPLTFIDLTLDASGYAHVVYLSSGTPQQILYWYQDSDGSNVSFGPQLPDDGFSYTERPVSIARTSGGTLHVAFETIDYWDSLWYVNWSLRGGWGTLERRSVDEQEIHAGISLSLNSTGDPGIVYSTIYNPSQLFTQQRNCSPLPCTWSSPQVVDFWAAANAYHLPSLVTDGQNHYRISYTQIANGTRYLQYVHVNQAQMEFRPVFIDTGLGLMSSLALSPTGSGWISFSDATNGDLLFAWQNVQVFLPMVKK
jgi:hypothetical protein